MPLLPSDPRYARPSIAWNEPSSSTLTQPQRSIFPPHHAQREPITKTTPQPSHRTVPHREQARNADQTNAVSPSLSAKISQKGNPASSLSRLSCFSHTKWMGKVAHDVSVLFGSMNFFIYTLRNHVTAPPFSLSCFAYVYVTRRGKKVDDNAECRLVHTNKSPIP